MFETAVISALFLSRPLALSCVLQSRGRRTKRGAISISMADRVDVRMNWLARLPDDEIQQLIDCMCETGTTTMLTALARLRKTSKLNHLHHMQWHAHADININIFTYATHIKACRECRRSSGAITY